MTIMKIPYLIVGAGPVGLAAARLLSIQGGECMVIERRDGPLRQPAAHVVNARTLEIFRQAGLDMDAISAIASDPADAGHVNFVTHLGGELIGRLPFERQGPQVLDVTPTPLRNISQHRLEPMLAKTVQATPDAELRYSTEWVSSEQDDDGVTSVIRDLSTGHTFEVKSRYVLAADGAGSRVRKSLGIAMVGPPALQSFVMIHFRADLRSLIADRPGVLHFVMDPTSGGTFIAHDTESEWVFMTSYDPTEESIDDYPHDRCEMIVNAGIGAAAPEIEILGTSTWHMSAQVAERMRDGRIFLVGDAAHRFPPTGGLGLNTGVGDAHGLAWKLRAVDEGWADASILDTYASERQPIAGTNCEQSTTNAFKLVLLIEALGITTTPTTEGMLAALADPAKGPAIAAAVDEQATHFDMIGLQLGYCYGDGALARDGDGPEPIDDPRVFEPDAAVGSRLPHAWSADGRSTLDLIEPGVMTLISFGEHDLWAQKVDATGVPLRHVRVGDDVEECGSWSTLCRVKADGALLVRPDQHIAWRSDSVSAPGPSALADALVRVLGS